VSYQIPKLSTWCSYCIDPAAYGNQGPCPDHRGPGGEPVEYAGRDAYEPSAQVLGVVGGRYDGWRGIVECFGYDPRHGYWMRVVATGERFNVSERAIGATYHRVRFTWGARELLGLIVRLGRLPTDAEAEKVDVGRAQQTLLDLDYLTAEGVVTDLGRRALSDGSCA
jgi:hypothetical protein